MWVIKMLILGSLKSILVTSYISCKSENGSVLPQNKVGREFRSEHMNPVGNNVGETAPDFQLTTEDGTLTSNEIASNARPAVLFFAASY